MRQIKFMLFLTVLAAGAVTAAVRSEQKAKGYAVGDVAADFNLKNVDGKMVSLKSLKKAKGAIVVFTCNHCPYAVAYEDRIIALNKKFEGKGYPVVAINPNDPAVEADDSYEKMQVRAKEKGFKFPYLFDEGQKIYPVYGATRTPHVFVLSKTGEQFTVEYIGAIDDNSKDASLVTKHYVEDAVNALLAGKKPEVTSTKAVGCGIKSKE